jgi:hypothetical protein
METLESAAAKTDFLNWFFFFWLVKKLDEKFYTSLSLSLYLSIYLSIYIGKSIDQRIYILEFSSCSWPSQQHIIGNSHVWFQTQNMQTDKPEGDGRHWYHFRVPLQDKCGAYNGGNPWFLSGFVNFSLTCLPCFLFDDRNRPTFQA